MKISKHGVSRVNWAFYQIRLTTVAPEWAIKVRTSKT